MPDISIVPWLTPWGPERDPSCAHIADRVLHHLLPAMTGLHRANAVELGLDPAEMAVVEVLGVVPALRLAALAERVALSHAAASGAAARLEDRTWVERTNVTKGYLEVGRAEGTAEVVASSLQDVRSPLAAAASSLTAEERVTVLAFLEEVIQIVSVRTRARDDRRRLRTLTRRRREWLHEPVVLD